MGTTIELAAADGHRFAAYRAEPAGKPRGALVVIQEIFGVNSHVKGVADGYAADGYLAIAPALFDRTERGLDIGYSQPEIDRGRAIMQKVSMDDAMKDVAAAIKTVAAAGKVGIVGYCWGGTVAWVAASKLDGLACSAPHYGGGILANKDLKPRCPVLLHFGETDHAIPVDQVRAWLAARPELTAHIYPAGHGFNCDQRGSFHADSAKLARTRTLEFLRRYVG
ncbi:MAG TPA: dienelactone hydrolase family protein [Burkholderiales bacterium]|nr:dienelactone hydrolase family protein [Burkholderiales bacterium]